MLEHTVTLGPSPYSRYQAVCTCDWKALPSHYKAPQRRAAERHLKRVQNDALMDALLDAAGRGEKVSISAWKTAHPIPQVPF
jgi:hypothetical protein